MCQSGVNNNQLKSMIGMVNDSVSMSQEWLKEVHHLAGHAGLSTEDDIAKAVKMLGEVRVLLLGAENSVEDAPHSHPDVEVELV